MQHATLAAIEDENLIANFAAQALVDCWPDIVPDEFTALDPAEWDAVAAADPRLPRAGR